MNDAEKFAEDLAKRVAGSMYCATTVDLELRRQAEKAKGHISLWAVDEEYSRLLREQYEQLLLREERSRRGLWSRLFSR